MYEVVPTVKVEASKWKLQLMVFEQGLLRRRHLSALADYQMVKKAGSSLASLTE
jgi:hypothetical protein